MKVLLVPGLYHPIAESAQQFTYDHIAKLWTQDGHHTVVHRFGWYEHASLKNQQEHLAETIDAIEGNDVYAVGASAGGLAVINALADRPDKLQGIATIASPLRLTAKELEKFLAVSYVPPLFEAAYRECDMLLSNLGERATRLVVSFHGQKDGRVPTEWSRRDSIPHYRLHAKGHNITILAALTIYRHQVQEKLSSLKSHSSHWSS